VTDYWENLVFDLTEEKLKVKDKITVVLILWHKMLFARKNSSDSILRARTDWTAFILQTDEGTEGTE